MRSHRNTLDPLPEWPDDCGELTMTNESSDERRSPPTELGNELREAFRAPLQVGHRPLLYRLGLMLVGPAMVVLPMVYLAIATLFGLLVLLHAVYNIGILSNVLDHGVPFAIITLTVYVGPIAIGVITIFFMFKPIFAGRARRMVTVELSPAGYPLLFYFVRSLCSMVGAPVPSRICIDMQVNASAGLRRGWASLLGNDLVLTIGLPLIAGLSLRQLAGVLAHEFGHFSQGAGMRFTYIIRSINEWFARVVYTRDVWDMALADAVRDDNRHGAVRVVLLMAQFFVWLTRGILWTLMVCGHVIGSFMLRQMEYDADRYEILIAGSRTFVRTQKRIRELAIINTHYHDALAALWEDHRFVDDFPSLVASEANSLPLDVQSAIQRAGSEAKSRWFDSHPSDLDRGRKAYRAMVEGVFRLEYPATVLFPDFARLCRENTLRYLRDEIGLDVRREDLRAYSTVQMQAQLREQEIQVQKRYYCDMLTASQPLLIPSMPPSTTSISTEEAREGLRSARDYVCANSGLMRETRVRLDRVVERIRDSHAAKALNDAGLRGNLLGPESSGAHRESPDQTIRELHILRQELRAGLETFYQRMADRLVGGIRFSQATASEAERSRVAALLEVARAMGRMADGVEQWRLADCVCQQLTDNSFAQRDNECFRAALESAASRLHQSMTRVRDALLRIVNPFKSDSSKSYVSEQLFGCIPWTDQVTDLLHASRDSLNAYDGLHASTMGQLALSAEKGETVAFAHWCTPPGTGGFPGCEESNAAPKG